MTTNYPTTTSTNDPEAIRADIERAVKRESNG
jgi:hypothetical protein